MSATRRPTPGAGQTTAAASARGSSRRRPASTLAPLSIILLGALMLVAAPPAVAAQGPVGLGRADRFAVLAASGITNTGSTTITGDIGTFPTPSMTGFGSVTLTGANQADNAVTQGAKIDLVTAYDDAFGRTPATDVPVELGGTTRLAGVYTSPTFGLTGTLTLDAKGNADAMFIFQAGSTLITEVNSDVLLINGADPCHVVWQVGSSATFKTGTDMVGDVLAQTSISAQGGATFKGRLLARTGAVTLINNTITNGTCAPPDTSDTSDTSTPTTVATTTPTTVTTTPTTVATTTPTTVGPTPTTVGPTPTTDGSTTRAPLVSVSSLPAKPRADTPAIPGVPVPTTVRPASVTPGVPLTTTVQTDLTSSGGPAVPLRSTPSTPSTPSLPRTGVPILGPFAMGLALMVLGTAALVAGRRRRPVQDGPG